MKAEVTMSLDDYEKLKSFKEVALKGNVIITTVSNYSYSVHYQFKTESDALSDLQLKIYELQKENESLRGGKESFLKNTFKLF